MTNLTEQWKNGELETGKEYWVRLTDEWKNSIEQVYFNGEDFERFDIDDIEEVLAPVPSYEEWQELHKRLKDTQNLELEVRRENQQLKELLNYIRDEIADMPSTAMQRGFGWISEAAYRIDNAIGEKK